MSVIEFTIKKPNSDVIRIVEDLLKDAKSGRLQVLAAVMLVDGKKGTRVCTPFTPQDAAEIVYELQAMCQQIIVSTESDREFEED